MNDPYAELKIESRYTPISSGLAITNPNTRRAIIREARQRDDQDAIILDTDTFSGMNAEVHAATSGGDTAVAMTVEIPNAPEDIIETLQSQGLVALDAGWRNTTALPSPTRVFYGSIDVAYMSRTEGQDILHIEATSNPSILSQTFVPVSSPAKPATAKFTYARALRQLFESVGGRILLPGDFEDTILYDYTATKSVLEEAGRLVDRFNTEAVARNARNLRAEERSGGITVRSRRGRPEGNTRPYQLLSSDLSGAGQFTYAVVGILDDGTQDNTTGFLEIDLDVDTVYGVTPVIVRNERSLTDAGLLPADIDRPEAVTASIEQRITLPLDPRAALGVRVDTIGKGGGTMVVTDLIHMIGEWRTQMQGPFGRK